MQENDHFCGHYSPWRATRLKHILRHYGAEFFQGKRLLELGCGHGDMGGFFHMLGASVVCSDAREQHLSVVAERYPFVGRIQVDLDSQFPFGHFDIILHCGVLYHIADFKRHLLLCCASCDHLILDTEVADSEDPQFYVRFAEAGYDQAFNGTGTRASAKLLEDIITEGGMEFKRTDDARLNSGYHLYDWKPRNENRWTGGQRRFWFCERLPAAHG